MAPKTLLPVNPKVNDKWYNIRRFMGEITRKNSQMGYSAAYPMGRELIKVGSGCEMNSVQVRLRFDILAALSRVYAEDRELLSDNIDVCERSLMHRFTHYFMDIVESGADGFYEGLHVDGEYNRHGVDTKRSSNSLIFPDVIVHRRGDDSDNLCVIEFKKSLTAGGKRRIRRTIEGDVEKLQNMTIPRECGGEFGYQWGGAYRISRKE